MVVSIGATSASSTSCAASYALPKLTVCFFSLFFAEQCFSGCHIEIVDELKLVDYLEAKINEQKLRPKNPSKENYITYFENNLKEVTADKKPKISRII